MRYILILALMGLSACTDASWDKWRVLGNAAEVKCFSGPTLIFHAISTGKIQNEENSDGYFARWEVVEAHGEWKRVDVSKTLAGGVSGNCIMLYVD